MTILDGMILVGGCAVSAWLFKSEPNSDWLHPKNLLDWVVVTAYAEYGPTIVAPLVLGVQFLRGRRRPLLPGELAWLVIALELLPVVHVAMSNGRDLGPWEDWWRGWYVQTWLLYCSPPLVLLCAAVALVWHFRVGRPRHWSHRLGLGMTLAQCVPSAMLIAFWRDL